MYRYSLRRGWNIATAFATSSHAPAYFRRSEDFPSTLARSVRSRPTFWFQSVGVTSASKRPLIAL